MGEGINGWYYGGTASVYGKKLALSKCKDCRNLREESGTSGTFDYKYQCIGGTASAAAKFGMGKDDSNCERYSNKATSGAILDKKPRPPLVKIVVTGLIVSVIWAAALVVYGTVVNDLTIDTPVILTLLCGIPAGTVAFSLLRLLKNLINKGATAAGNNFSVGGKLFGWLFTTVLLWASPAIIYFVLATIVFNANII